MYHTWSKADPAATERTEATLKRSSDVVSKKRKCDPKSSSESSDDEVSNCKMLWHKAMIVW